jgi:sortase B
MFYLLTNNFFCVIISTKGVTMEEKNSNNKRKPVWIFICVISVVVLLCCCGYIVFLAVSSEKQNDTYKKVVSEVSATTETASESQNTKVENPIDFDKLIAKNSDIVAWIKVDGTNIDYPVLRAPEDDEEYYLHRDYEKNYLYAGSIYMESYNQGDFSDRDTILYGHNMADGSMFASLHKFEDTTFFNKHKTFSIYTPDSIKTYKIYSAYEYDDRHINNSFNHFLEDDVFQEYINYSLNPTSALLSNVRKGSKVTIDDKLVTLSTCTNNRPNNRYLVQGVLIKDEETR